MRSIQLPFWLLLVCSVDVIAQPLVSMTELLNNQEKYNRKAICVYGIASFKFEKSQLRTKDGSLWLSLYEPPYTEETIKNAQERITHWSIYEGQCVLIGGVFRKGGKHGAGHFGGWRGEIANISSIEGADALKCQ